MRLINELDNYLTDKKYKIIFKDNTLNIINYLEIIDFSAKEIKIKYDKGITRVIGHDLVITKMLDDEILINGFIDNIEL